VVAQRHRGFAQFTIGVVSLITSTELRGLSVRFQIGFPNGRSGAKSGQKLPKWVDNKNERS